MDNVTKLRQERRKNASAVQVVALTPLKEGRINPSTSTKRLLNRIKPSDRHSTLVNLTLQKDWEGGGYSQEIAERIFLPSMDEPAIKDIRRNLAGIVIHIYYRSCRAPGVPLVKGDDLESACEPMVNGLMGSIELRSMLSDIAGFYSRINDMDNVMSIEFSDPLRNPDLDHKFRDLLGWYAFDSRIHLNMRAMLDKIDRDSADALLFVTLHEWLHYYFDMQEGIHKWDSSPQAKGYVDKDHTAEFARLERMMGIRW
jgi:hypothetical protein